MTSVSLTGIVMRSSSVPERFSAASERIVTAGMTKMVIRQRQQVEDLVHVARSTSQNPPMPKPAMGM